MTAVTNTNERLYALLVATDQTSARFAGKVGVDPKTVERWITTGRNPHPRIARRAANLLNVDDVYLWPTLYARRQATIKPADELIACYPGRTAIPADLWSRLFDGARERVDIMADFGLTDHVRDLPGLLRGKATKNVRVRVVLADPDTATNPLDAARLQATEAIYQPLAACEGVSVARYAGPLATTVIRIDDDVLVRSPIDGCPAALAPVLHLRYLPAGSMARLYLTSLDCVWETSIPVHPATGPNLRVVS
jgi:transcriptional regulator with XRE-family HTH domain